MPKTPEEEIERLCDETKEAVVAAIRQRIDAVAKHRGKLPRAGFAVALAAVQVANIEAAIELMALDGSRPNDEEEFRKATLQVALTAAFTDARFTRDEMEALVKIALDGVEITNLVDRAGPRH